MNGWKNFWEYLNIRKALAMVIVMAYIVLVFMIRTDVLVTGLGTLAVSAVSYWYGYQNGLGGQKPNA